MTEVSGLQPDTGIDTASELVIAPPSLEEVLASFPKIPNTSSYADMNAELSRVFIEEVYEPVEMRGAGRFAETAATALDPICFDGVIAGSDEWDLWMQVMQIAFQKNDSGQLTLWSEFQDWFLHRAEANSAERLDADVVLFLSSRLLQMREEVPAYQKVILDYALEELHVAGQSGEGLSYVRSELTNLSDLRTDGAFQDFLSQKTGLRFEDLQEFSGTPVDYVESPLAGAPTVVVFLDTHTVADVAFSQIHDFALMRPYRPVYGIEGAAFGETLEHSRLHVRLWREEVRYLERRIQAAERKLMSPLSAKRAEKLTAEITRWKVDLEFCRSGLADAEKEECLFAPDFKDRESELRNEALEDEKQGEQLHALERAAYRLYFNQIVFQGYEYGDWRKFDAELATFTAVDVGLLGDLETLPYRSEVALDNMRGLAEANPRGLGAMTMGKGHYTSLRDRALERGDVNVIFIRPEKFDEPFTE